MLLVLALLKPLHFVYNCIIAYLGTVSGREFGSPDLPSIEVLSQRTWKMFLCVASCVGRLNTMLRILQNVKISNVEKVAMHAAQWVAGEQVEDVHFLIDIVRSTQMLDWVTTSRTWSRLVFKYSKTTLQFPQGGRWWPCGG